MGTVRGGLGRLKNRSGNLPLDIVVERNGSCRLIHSISTNCQSTPGAGREVVRGGRGNFNGKIS